MLQVHLDDSEDHDDEREGSVDSCEEATMQTDPATLDESLSLLNKVSDKLKQSEEKNGSEALSQLHDIELMLNSRLMSFKSEEDEELVYQHTPSKVSPSAVWSELQSFRIGGQLFDAHVLW